jgi:outer membrane lipoprotein SlyB
VKRTRFRPLIEEIAMRIRLLGMSALAAALVTAGCATTAPGYGNGYGTAPSSGYGNTSCQNCGTVTHIEAATRGQNVPNSTGAVLGGIVGAVAGHEISDRTGGSKGNQNISAVAGAVGGAVAGNAIQNRVQTQGTYNVYIRMDDGRSAMVTQTDLGSIREGSYVSVSGGRAYVR